MEIRVYKHELGWDPTAYTYSRRPLKLVWHNFFTSNREAIGWEKRIKGWSRKKKEALINNQLELLPGLAACKNETNWLIQKQKKQKKEI